MNRREIIAVLLTAGLPKNLEDQALELLAMDDALDRLATVLRKSRDGLRTDWQTAGQLVDSMMADIEQGSASAERVTEQSARIAEIQELLFSSAKSCAQCGIDLLGMTQQRMTAAAAFQNDLAAWQARQIRAVSAKAVLN